MKITTLVIGCLMTITGFSQMNYTAYDAFLKKYVSAGGEVNYKAIKASRSELDKITSSFSAAKGINSWSKEDQLAFWINAYNVFTIALLTENYPLKSIMDLDNGKTWDVKRITIEGKKYSLNNIENDIIRPKFKDARIHFAVNCGAKSCPPLLNAAYQPKTLNSQLDEVTSAFINNPKMMVLSTKSISISRIFEWYKVDFDELIGFINQYSKTKLPKNVKINYTTYDWSLNGK